MRIQEKMLVLGEALIDELDLTEDEKNLWVPFVQLTNNKPFNAYEAAKMLLKLEKEKCVRLALRNHEGFDRRLMLSSAQSYIYVKPNREKLTQLLRTFSTTKSNPTSKEEIVTIGNVEINMNRQEVMYKNVRSGFDLGSLPWTMIRMCIKDDEDEIGKTSIDTFQKNRTKDALHRVVSRMNRPWRHKIGENVFRIQHECFCVDPQPVKGTTPH